MYFLTQEINGVSGSRDPHLIEGNLQEIKIFTQFSIFWKSILIRHYRQGHMLILFQSNFHKTYQDLSHANIMTQKLHISLEHIL